MFKLTVVLILELLAMTIRRMSSQELTTTEIIILRNSSLFFLVGGVLYYKVKKELKHMFKKVSGQLIESCCILCIYWYFGPSK